MERLSAAGVAIVVDVRSAVESGRAQAGAREIGALEQLGERDLHFHRIDVEEEVRQKNNLLGGHGTAEFLRQHLGGEG